MTNAEYERMKDAARDAAKETGRSVRRLLKTLSNGQEGGNG